MTTLTRQRGMYPGSAWNAPMTEPMMLPDDVLAAQRAVTEPATGAIFARHVALDRREGVVPPLNRHRLLWPEPRLDWAQSVALVRDAFKLVGGELAAQAAAIIDDETRLHRTETATGDCAAFTTPKGWKGRKQVEITFESDGTISDAVYLAHELGHMLAFDMAEEAGSGGDMMPRHAIELPAFYTQVMFYDYLASHPDPALRRAGFAHAAGELTRSLYGQKAAYAAQGLDAAATSSVYKARLEEALGPEWMYFRAAGRAGFGAYDLHTYSSAPLIGLGLYHVAPRSPELLQALFARGQATDILEIFAASGVTTTEALQEFFRQALARAIAPLAQAAAAATAA
ncbi:MAG TPA: hypothetical protein VEF76_06460 [Patescibacteria group bacterium]|nr:hypothetical protein [Patescibacteria group bacterium]